MFVKLSFAAQTSRASVTIRWCFESYEGNPMLTQIAAELYPPDDRSRGVRSVVGACWWQGTHPNFHPGALSDRWHPQIHAFAGFTAVWDEVFIRVGLMAVIAFTILIVVSLRPIRARTYEVFYFTHFLMVLWVSPLILPPIAF